METATNAILNSQNLLEEQGLDLPQDLKAVCPTLLFLLLFFPLTMNNKYRPSDAIYIKGCLKQAKNPAEDTVEEDARPTNIKGAYTARDVIKQNDCLLVDGKILFNPQTKEYLGCYQRAVTMVLGRLDSSECKKVEELAQSWNEQGAPHEVQVK